MDRQHLIDEINRVAGILQTRSLSRAKFAKQANISTAIVEASFGSWNEAIREAGLLPMPPGGRPVSERKRLLRLAIEQDHPASEQEADKRLLQDLIRLTRELGKRPSLNQVNAKGSYGISTYQRLWGTVSAACEAAYAKYGNPLLVNHGETDDAAGSIGVDQMTSRAADSTGGIERSITIKGSDNRVIFKINQDRMLEVFVPISDAENNRAGASALISIDQLGQVAEELRQWQQK